MLKLKPRALSAKNFAPFGEVADINRAQKIIINDGLTERFNNLATIDVADGGGRPLVGIFRTTPVAFPFRVKKMEKHPLGSQLFLPMQAAPFLVLVAAGAENIAPEDLKLFITDGRQGINFHKNTWHHYQLVLQPSQFVVVDRGGDGDNLIETTVKGDAVILPGGD